ncbi:PAS domain S-box protein [candidate division WOR-3 bacterium]|nr:PAS domain S-box protein [candidate division WOR-3 bacterium]
MRTKTHLTLTIFALASFLFFFLLNNIFPLLFLDLVFCLVFFLLTSIFIDRYILRKISTLSKFAEDLTVKPIEQKRLDCKGKDEISKLCLNINLMLDSITRSSREEILNSEMANAVIRNSPIGISVRDSRGKLLFFNERWKNLWNMNDIQIDEDRQDRKELKLDYKDSYLSDWLTEVENLYKNGGSLYIPQLFVKRPRGGDPIWISHYFYSILDEKGYVDRVVIMTEDITEKKIEEDKRKEKAVKAKIFQEVLLDLIRMTSEDLWEYYALLLEKTANALKVSHSSIWFYNEDQTMLVCFIMYDKTRGRFEKGFSIKTEDCPLYFNYIEINRTLAVEDVYSETSTSELADVYCKNMNIYSILDAPIRSEGSVIGVITFENAGDYVEWTDEDENFVGSVSDIASLAYESTEKEKTKKLLEESENKYRNIVDNSLVGVFIMDTNGNFIFANEAMPQILDCDSSDELLKHNISSFYVKPEGASAFFENIYSVKKLKNWEIDLRTKKSKLKRTLLNVYFDGKALTGMMMDISAIKETEENLNSEKERLAVTLKSIGDGVIVTDMNGKVVLMNSVAEKLTGWREEDSVGRNVDAVFCIVDKMGGESIENPVDRAIKSGEIANLTEGAVLISKEGQERILADSAALIKDKSGKIIGVVLVFRDVTEKIKIEQELSKVDKLETVGILAGGIAHDFNNMLAGILANISLAKIVPEEKAKIKFLEKAEKAIDRARELTTQLLVFSKGGAPVKNVVSLKSLIEETATFALTGSKSKCIFQFQNDLFNVEADPGQLSQVINNLVINADHSMASGGKIIIEAVNSEVDDFSTLPLEKGDYVKISVKDEGVGISPENLNKIFDPFYSTKKKGSGLGLSICLTIAKNHGGHITVYSEQDKGSVFNLYLPATHSDEMVNEKTNNIVFGKGDILVMDDEIMIREIAKDMLSYLGYKCDVASNGDQAVKLYDKKVKNGERYDAVILDLTVPGEKGGKDTIKLIKNIDEKAIGIVSSGYSDDPVLSRFWNYGFDGRILKPYKLEELSAVLSDLLKK